MIFVTSANQFLSSLPTECASYNFLSYFTCIVVCICFYVMGVITDDDSVQFSFLDLPWEDVLHRCLLPYLHWHDLFNLRQTSRLCCCMVDSYLHQCRVINLSSVSQRMNCKAFQVIVGSNTNINTLILSNCKWINDQLLGETLTNNVGLSQIDISGCTALTNQTVRLLAREKNSLTKLALRECYWLSSESLVFVSTYSSKLECIDLSSCWEINDDAIQELLQNCPGLKFLSLARIYGITDRTLRNIADHCPFLEHLNVTACWRVSDYGIRFVGEYCQHLKVLQVKDCRDVTEVSLAKLRLRMKIDRPCHSAYLCNYLKDLRLNV